MRWYNCAVQIREYFTLRFCCFSCVLPQHKDAKDGDDDNGDDDAAFAAAASAQAKQIFPSGLRGYLNLMNFNRCKRAEIKPRNTFHVSVRQMAAVHCLRRSSVVIVSYTFRNCPIVAQPPAPMRITRTAHNTLDAVPETCRRRFAADFPHI